MFVSKTLCNTADIPFKSLAYYGINNCTGDLRLQGLYFQLDEETEVYIGFQANLLNGSSTQEFRAEQIALYSPKEAQEMHAANHGWQKVDALPEDVSQYFFAIYEHETDNGLMLGTGNKQDNAYQTLWYEADIYPEVNKNALFTFDAFDSSNHSGAKFAVGGSPADNAAKWLVITSAGYPDICLQSNDSPNNWNYRTENNGEGWTDRAYVSTTYTTVPDAIVPDASPSGYWTLSQNDAFECEYANYLPTKVGSSYFNKWQGSGNLTNRSISQQLSGLPNGKYRLSVRTSSNVIHQGAWLFANSDKTDMTTVAGSGVVSVTTNVG